MKEGHEMDMYYWGVVCGEYKLDENWKYTLDLCEPLTPAFHLSQ